MAYKNLMVHLDQGERTAKRLALAVSMAHEHSARLVGVFGQRGHAQRVGLVSTWPSEAYAAARDASKRTFEEATVGLANVHWIDINRGSDAELLQHVTDQARYCDLILMGQHDERSSAHVPDDLVAEVILNSGRPALVLPYIGDFPTIGKNPLIAWSNTREAARALNDSLPLIAHCSEVMVLSLCAHLEDGNNSCAEVARHVQTHGITSKTEVILVEDFGIMDLLLNRVSDRGADLLVMGAHAHHGLPFLTRGNGTRYILQHMTVPVLMAN
ncbi:MAG: universal stress protein [Rhodoferax sp.]|nr:universal stress protein [Rhodoferax sp.]MCF8211147.1 universal stress protein [Rhodoferax sp.]